jgi:hypothetical protein
MNKKIITMLALALTLLISSCITTTTAEITSPINKGTLDYKDYDYVTFTGGEEVELVFISSVMPASVLLVEKTAYYPVLNETKYKVTSQNITPTHEFIPGVKTFIYQDMNTGQLYTLSVDYSMVDVPLSPLETAYEELLTNYNALLVNYTDIIAIEDVLNNISITMAGYYNSTAENLSNMTLDTAIATILADLTNTAEEYQIVKNKLDEKTDDYNELSSKYTTAYNEKKKIQTDYDDLLVEHTNITTNFETVKSRLQNTSGLLLQYQQFEENLQSLRSDVYFNNRMYHTPYYYNQRIQQLEDEIGLAPIYVAIAVFLTVLACYLYYKRVYGDRPLSSVEKDVDYNYPEEAGLFDRFSMHKLLDKLKRPKKNGTNVFNPDTNTIVANDDDPEIEVEEDTTVTREELNQKISDIHKILDSITVKKA